MNFQVAMPTNLAVDPTPDDEDQGAEQINNVIIFIKIKVIKINVQVAMPSDIAAGPTHGDEDQDAVQVNEVIIFHHQQN